MRLRPPALRLLRLKRKQSRERRAARKALFSRPTPIVSRLLVTAYIHRILDYALGLAVLLLVARFLFLITELPLPDAAVVRLLGWSNRLCAPLEPEFPAWNFPSGRRLETAPLAAIAILGLFVQGLHWLVHRVAYRGPIP